MASQQEVAAGDTVVTRVRTSAERAFADGFEATIETLPGSGWVEQVRRRAMERFEAIGLPTRRLEAYKYTDLRERLVTALRPATGLEAPDAIERAELTAALGPLADIDACRMVFVDGRFRPELSDLAALDDAAECVALMPLLDKAPSWLEAKFAAGRLADDDAVVALNTAYMSDGLLLKVKPGQSLARPVMIVAARASATARTVALRHVIAVEAGAQLTLIEANVALKDAASKATINALSDVTLAEGGKLEHIACVRDGPEAQHLTTWSTQLGHRAHYGVFQLSLAAGLARHGIAVELAGREAKLDLSGVFLGRANAHGDTTLLVDHAKPGCESRELFKAVLDERARGIFQGKVIVRPGAEKTDGKQMARALMLSNEAEFDSKPELEIYADDVQCGHGSTVAEIDPDLMFYCLARGIPKPQARALLIEAFIGEAIDSIGDDDVRSAVTELARNWLDGLRSDKAACS